MHRCLPLLVALAGCAPSTGVLAARLEACGLLTEGDLGPRALFGIYAPTGCYQDCLAAVECDALEAAICRTDVTLLVACDRRCAHRCADGALIGVERVCDGTPHCADMGDEEGCPGWGALACRDGSRAMGATCDGLYQCGDGSDEAGCAYPTCGGSPILPYQRCNGYSECADGSDEAGCPTHVCENGRTITHSPDRPGPRCDGAWQCADGSDERGCAELRLSCGS